MVCSGISLEDLMSHMDTNTGEKYFEQNAIVLPVARDSTVWIPWGWKVVPMAVPAEELKKDQSEAYHYGVCWALPFLDKELASVISAKCWQSIMKTNGDFLTQK